MESEDSNQRTEDLTSGKRMPVLFIGHGSPMNAIQENEFSNNWRNVGRTIPCPRAILCVSAHWETAGSLVTAMEQPRTIHDFGGFPHELYEVRYPAAGSPRLAQEVRHIVGEDVVGLDEAWGLDHGCWSVMKQMYPEADVPVVQLSLNYAMPPRDHYNLGKQLSPLRQKGVLIVGSGNIVHNLALVKLLGDGLSDFNRPFGFDWAIEASDLFKRLINEKHHKELIDYPSLGKAVAMAVPTPEHYLPLLYALALQREDEKIAYFNDKPVAGSLTMTSLIIDKQE
jgi:4,5-DOPA dioxygenase extradiol